MPQHILLALLGIFIFQSNLSHRICADTPPPQNATETEVPATFTTAVFFLSETSLPHFTKTDLTQFNLLDITIPAKNRVAGFYLQKFIYNTETGKPIFTNPRVGVRMKTLSNISTLDVFTEAFNIASLRLEPSLGVRYFAQAKPSSQWQMSISIDNILALPKSLTLLQHLILRNDYAFFNTWAWTNMLHVRTAFQTQNAAYSGLLQTGINKMVTRYLNAGIYLNNALAWSWSATSLSVNLQLFASN